jgi:calcium-dependent protein kinase
VDHNATTPKAKNNNTASSSGGGTTPMKVEPGGKTDSAKKRIVTMEPSVRSFAGPSSTRRDRSDPVQITDALADVRVKYHINPKELGHGHYGVVRKCMDRETKEWFAIKSIRKAKVSKIEVLKREIEILKEVKHPNIIELIDVFEDAKYLHLVTELCTGGELFDRIIAKTQSVEGHYSEQDAASLIRDILDAIAYCHSKEIVHRDLKPENFLFLTEAEDAPIKIIDFGLSRHNDADKGIMKTKVGA